jgi:hypothetical protein
MLYKDEDVYALWCERLTYKGWLAKDIPTFGYWLTFVKLH